MNRDEQLIEKSERAKEIQNSRYNIAKEFGLELGSVNWVPDPFELSPF